MVEDLRIVPAGDAALLLELPARIDPAISDCAVALARAVRAGCGGSLRDVVVGYCSVTVYFDPLQVDAAWLESAIWRLAGPGSVATPTPGSRLQAEGQADGEPARTRGFRLQAEGQADWGDTVHQVPVCYDSEYGPDLPAVAAFAGGTPDDVIALHSGTTYRVYVVGFVPGFPYMARVDPRLAIPRRPTPRAKVPAGSVAIAAGQTGIYPSETPGGWHLLGRTHVKPYDPSRPEPFLFKPGDRVRFHPIGRDEFERGA